MSTRTIIEINHDYLNMTRQPEFADMLRLAIQSVQLGGELAEELRRKVSPCVRILGQRHHSEPEWKQEKP